MKHAGDNYWLPVKTLYSPAIFIIPIPKNRNFQLRMCTLVEGIELFAIFENGHYAADVQFPKIGEFCSAACAAHAQQSFHFQKSQGHKSVSIF